MKILVLTVGDSQVASTHYRFGQFEKGLRDDGVHLVLQQANAFADWEMLGNYDLVVVQKRLMRTSWVKRLRAGSKTLMFDTDDAIWEAHGRKHSWWTRARTHHRLRAIVSAADACTVPNTLLARHLEVHAKHVEWIPMALDEETWFPAASRKPGPLRIGWAGSPPNLFYLRELSEVLHEVQTLRPGVEVVVYSGEAPSWTRPVRSVHHRYSPGTESQVVRTFDIGLLPLPNDAFAAGKSPIKALQYAACGVPCIASAVGATCELVANGVSGITTNSPVEWRDALLELIDDENLRLKIGKAARDHFLRSHSRKSSQALMIACWNKLLDQSTLA